MCDQDIIRTVDTSNDDDKDEKQEILDALWEAAQNGEDLLSGIKDFVEAINNQSDNSKDDDDDDEDDES